MTKSLIKLENVLTEDEQRGLAKWQSKEEPPLSEGLSDQLYSLFVSGKSCQEIKRAHGSLAFGAIVDARVRFGWDERREAYFQKLHKETEEVTLNANLIAVKFLSDLLNLTTILQGEAIAKYLATRDPVHLEGVMPITNIKDFKAITETLIAITDRQPPNMNFNDYSQNINMPVTQLEDHAGFLSKSVKDITDKAKK